MSNKNRKPATPANVQADTVATMQGAQVEPARVDWDTECAIIREHAKSTATGSKARLLAKAGEYLAGKAPGVPLFRSWCGQDGARAVIGANRNALAKIERLADKVATGLPWHVLSAEDVAARRSVDASVNVAGRFILSQQAGGMFSKKDVRDALLASKRYEGGADAQAGAAVDALNFAGIIQREAAGGNGGRYTLVQRDVLVKLIPEAPQGE